MYAKPEETAEELIAAYRVATAAADRTIEDLELDAGGKHWSSATVSLRSMLLSVLLAFSRTG